MRYPRLVYLDNAATTFPKPQATVNEVIKCLTGYCGNPGRGSHLLSLKAAEKIFDCRRELSELLGLDKPENIFFTLNTTHAINAVIKGILKNGDHVIISNMEHNSVYRPIYKLADAGIIEYDVFDSLVADERRNPTRICANIARLLKPNTRLIFCSHVSNVCSAALPLQEIGAFAHRHNILFAVDAAQSAGHLPIDMKQMNIDFLCAPGHKGLYGLQGSAFVAINNELLLETLIEGGNGINSLEATMPDFSPERYEAGTLPTPSIAGLCEGVRALKKIGIDAIEEHERSLFLAMRDRLFDIAGATVYAPMHIGSTLLFNLDGISSGGVSEILNQNGICVRSGFHCAALGHKTLRTGDDGAVRISFGVFNTIRDVDRAWRCLKEIKK